MLSLKSFVISDKEDKENFDGVSDLALTLDRRDFFVNGYPVNSKKYPLIRKALLREKGKVQPDSVATIAPEVVPSVEVQRDVDLHMRDVSESPSHPPAKSLPPLPKLPSCSPSWGVSSESSSGSAPT